MTSVRQSDYQAKTAKLCSELPGDPEKLCQKVLRVLDTLDEVGLNLPLFLDLMWGDPACRKDGRLKVARTYLMHDPSLSSILDRWYENPIA